MNIIQGSGLAGVLALLLSGCATGPSLPPEVSGGRLRQGQAVWQPPGPATALAGELLVIANDAGESFSEFTKPPMVLVGVRRGGGGWTVEIPGRRQRWRGRGVGPGSLLWLHLAPALAGTPPPPPCRFMPGTDGEWILENPRTGERIEGFLQP